MAKVLIYGNANSPLVRKRGLIGQKVGHKIFWISPLKTMLPRVTSFGFSLRISRIRLLRVILEPFLVWGVIQKVKPDLIHVHYASKGFGVIPLLGKIPVVVSVMGSDILPKVGYRGVYALFTKLLLNHADVITSKSSYLDKALENIGKYKHKTIRLVWGVDLNLFRPGKNVKYWRKKLNIPSGCKVFFEPRNAKVLYNKHMVVRAFAKYLLQGGPPAILLLATGVPDQRYLKWLKSEIKRLNLNKSVRVLGPVSAEQMAEIYCLADVTISIPSSDGFPQSFWEALACGSCLLIADLPQYKEIVQNCVCVETVQVDNVDALVKKMIHVAHTSGNRGKQNKINRNYLRAHANLVTENKLVLHLYSKLLKKSRSI